MTEQRRQDGMSDVPRQVFETYLEALSGADVPAEVVARLRKALLDHKRLTERALREAVLPEGEQPWSGS